MAHLDENQVVALVRGQLSTDRIESVQSHLESCEECLEMVALYQQTTSTPDTHDTLIDAATEDNELELLAPGARLGRYQIVLASGRGGMGVVYQALDPELGRKVALKVVKPSIGAESFERFERRLVREARAMAKLSHPNVLTVYDVGVDEGRAFIASEWVDGQTVEVWMHEEPRRWQHIIDVFLQAAEGLWAAHQAGLVHRDFKPGNVLIGEDGRVRVFDFGLVRASDPQAGEATTELTRKRVVGTPAYMAPEQMSGEPVDARADQFSFCVSLYEAFEQKRPFTGTTMVELHAAIDAGRVIEPGKGRMPRWLWDIVRRGLRRRPEERFASLEVVSREIRSRLARRRRNRLAAVAVLGAMLATGAGLVGYWRGQGDPALQCSDDRVALGDAWSQERRDQVKAGLLGSALPFAEDAWSHSARLLDAYARDWRRQYRASCLETRVYKSQSETIFDRRMACYDELQAELDATTRHLAEGSKPSVLGAVEAAQELRSIASCDKDAVTRSAIVPSDPATHERLRPYWAEIKSVEHLLQTNQYNQALTRGRELATELAHFRHRPTEARLLQLEGRALFELGQLEEAAKAFEQALFAAEAGRDDERMAQLAADLYHLYRAKLEDPQAAQHWRQRAEAAAERVGLPSVTAKLERVKGAVAQIENKLEEAEKHYQESIRLLEELHGRYHLQIGATLAGLGHVYQTAGEPQKAEGYYRQALEVSEKTRGLQHPETAMILHALAGALSEQRRIGEAARLERRAYDIIVAVDGEEHARTAMVVNGLAEYSFLAGDFETARTMLAKSLTIKRKTLGDRHPLVASSLTNLAQVERTLRQPAAALQHSKEALEILLQSRGPEHPTTLRARLMLAEAGLAAGDATLAMSSCLAAEDGLRALADDGQVRALGARVAGCLGRAELLRGDRAVAKRWLDKSIARFAGEGDPGHLGLTYFAYAKIQPREADAALAATRAYQYFGAAGAPHALDLEEVRDWLRARGIEPPKAPAE